MPTARLQFLSEAVSELDEAFGWYLARSPQAAGAFLGELERASALVAETPDVWPAFHLGTRSYNLRGFPFRLIYRQQGDVVQVVAVAHHKRRPLYWRSR
jgi:toxin ParE1/3/4